MNDPVSLLTQEAAEEIWRLKARELWPDRPPGAEVDLTPAQRFSALVEALLPPQPQVPLEIIPPGLPKTFMGMRIEYVDMGHRQPTFVLSGITRYRLAGDHP